MAVALVAVAVGASAFAPLNEPLSAAEHGELVARTGTTVTPFQFVGAAGVRSEGGTLYRMGARFYDAGLRRFLSPDPLGIDGGFNLYAYADADPVNWIDPLGLCAQSGWGAPSVDASGFGTRSLSPSELSRVMSRMGLREEIHPLAMQTAISTAFKAAGMVALFAVPGPEDLVAGAVMAGLARAGGAARAVAAAARSARSSSDWILTARGTMVPAGKFGGVMGTRISSISGLSPRIRALSEAHITDNGIAILGQYQVPPGRMNYIQKATTGKYQGSSYFDLGSAWTPGEGRRANLHFLDIVGGRGDKIIFSTPKNDITAGSSLEMEYQYLMEKYGYKWVNQWSMRRGRL